MAKALERKLGEDNLPIPPYNIYNIGNNTPESLLDFISILQQELVDNGILPRDYDFEAHKKLVSMQPGDVAITYADTIKLEEDFNFKLDTFIKDGLSSFIKWYKEFYKI